MESQHPAPGPAALALAAGHLIEAAVVARRFANHRAVAAQLGVSPPRISSLIALTALSPEIQAEVLDLRVGGPLGALPERALHEVVATHADWRVQQWWWSLLAQPFDPDWTTAALPSVQAFPSGKRGRRGIRAIGDLPLSDLAALVARRPGQRTVGTRREALLVALADRGAPQPDPMVLGIAAASTPMLANELERLHGHRPASKHPDYLRRRVAWMTQAVRQGGLPKPISGHVIELREHLPERWRDALRGVARVYMTRAQHVAR